MKCLGTVGRSDLYCLKGKLYRLDPLKEGLVFERRCACEVCAKATRHEKRMRKISELMLQIEGGVR